MFLQRARGQGSDRRIILDHQYVRRCHRFTWERGTFPDPDPPVRAVLLAARTPRRCGIDESTVHRMLGPADPRFPYRASPFRQGGESFLRSEEHTSELQSLMRISYA